MSTILAFAGSNSSTSINYQLVKYFSEQITTHEVQLLNMINYPFPLYSEDVEKTMGFSNSLIELADDLKNTDGLLLGVNEHNGNPSAYTKNLTDWLSRLNRKFLDGKPVMLVGTSPGRGGASSALAIMEKTLPRFGADVITTFSLPSFKETFEVGMGITESALQEEALKALGAFLEVVPK